MQRSEPMAEVHLVVSTCRRAGLWLVLFSLGINLLVLAAPIYMMQVSDRVLSSGRTETLIFLTLIAAFAAVVMGVIEVARGQFLIRIGNWLDRNLSDQVIRSVLAMRLVGHGVSAQPLRDIATVRTALASPAVSALIDAPWVLGFIVVIWLLHPMLGLVALASATTLFIVALVNELASRKDLGTAGRLSIETTQFAESVVRNAEVVQALGMIPGLLRRYEKSNGDALVAQQRAGDRSAVLIGLSKSFRLLVQILILGAGAALVLRGELTSGGMIAGSILLGRALAPVEQSIGGWKQMVGAREAWQRLLRLFAEAPRREEAMPLPEPVGDLAFQQVTYVPPGNGRPILQGVTFDLPAGQVLGVIGPSAAGKSSLCRVITGVWKPTRGNARLDGADIARGHGNDLGRHIGYLPQNVELFAGTVAENIARMATDPDPLLVLDAARQAGVHEMILSLPSGYDTLLSDSGASLSGGQRQRIGLARAFYGRPQLVVLDEPNTNLDADGEAALVEALGEAKSRGSTIVLVTHQLGILRMVDSLLMLEGGMVAAFGPRDKILSQLRPASAPLQAIAGS